MNGQRSAEKIDWPALRARFRGTGLLFEGLTFADMGNRFRRFGAALALPYEAACYDGTGRWSSTRQWVFRDEAVRRIAGATIAGFNIICPAEQRAALTEFDAKSFDPANAKYWAEHAYMMTRPLGLCIVPEFHKWDRSGDVWRLALDFVGSNRLLILPREPGAPRKSETPKDLAAEVVA